MARLHDVVFDCEHPARLARFWAAVLDGYEVAPYDDVELERLRLLGVEDPEDDPAVLVQPRPPSGSAVTLRPDASGRPGDLSPSGRSGPRLWFQRVPERKISKNRLHLDLVCDEGGFDGELARLEALGATRAPRQDNPGLVVLLDPEGNELCLLRR